MCKVESRFPVYKSARLSKQFHHAYTNFRLQVEKKEGRGLTRSFIGDGFPLGTQKLCKNKLMRKKREKKKINAHSRVR